NWEAEKEIIIQNNKQSEKIRPDLSGYINKIQIAIEIQRSTYSVKNICKKIMNYKLKNIAILYIIPLRDELGDKPFRPRLFEKYLHCLYFGKIYYWNKGNGSQVKPVHYDKASRYIEQSEFYNENTGEMEYHGGYNLAYKTIKIPISHSLIDICNEFEKYDRKEFKPIKHKIKIPECTVFIDKIKQWWSNNIPKKNANIKDIKVILPNYNNEDAFDDGEEINDYNNSENSMEIIEDNHNIDDMPYNYSSELKNYDFEDTINFNNNNYYKEEILVGYNEKYEKLIEKLKVYYNENDSEYSIIKDAYIELSFACQELISKPSQENNYQTIKEVKDNVILALKKIFNYFINKNSSKEEYDKIKNLKSVLFSNNDLTSSNIDKLIEESFYLCKKLHIIT
ncbi:MAG: hypothetical protein KA792_10240, partial [Bacteroidales bacterium]|nr:hypothetical protein [Bacteroidales bacterium]